MQPTLKGKGSHRQEYKRQDQWGHLRVCTLDHASEDKWNFKRYICKGFMGTGFRKRMSTYAQVRSHRGLLERDK